MFKPMNPYQREELPSQPAKPSEPAKPLSPPPSREEIEKMLQQVLAENADVADSNVNGECIGEFLKQHTGALSLENLRTAVIQLRLRGQLELKLPPAPPQPVVVEPAEPVLEPLPEVPSYMGNFSTRADVLAIPPEKYKQWYHGKNGRHFANE